MNRSRILPDNLAGGRIAVWAVLGITVLILGVALRYIQPWSSPPTAPAPPKASARVVAPQAPPKPPQHQALATMPWYDGLVYLRNNNIPVTPYLPVVRNGLRSTQNWALRLREVYLLTHQAPWGEISGVLLEAAMAEVRKMPEGLPQAAKGAELLGTIFVGQPEALIANKLLWESYQQAGLRFLAAQQVVDSAKLDPTSPETRWLLEQAAGSFTGDFAFLHQAVEGFWLTALPDGHPLKKAPAPGLAWGQLDEDVAFEGKLSALPLPNAFPDLAGGDWPVSWMKLRALEFQMRRFYLTANRFSGNSERISALSTDDAATVQVIAARLRTILQAARSP